MSKLFLLFNLTHFPHVAFGPCQKCGGRAADYPASELTPADSTSNLDLVGNGHRLAEFRGELWCELCIKEEKQREESIDDHDKRQLEETFRASAGFKQTIT